VIGNPVTTPDGVTLIPVSRVSFGMATGGSEFPLKEKSGFGGGNGAGVKIEPVGFLVVKDGHVRMLNIAPPPSASIDRIIEMLPDLIDRVDEFIDKQQAKKQQ